MGRIRIPSDDIVVFAPVVAPSPCTGEPSAEVPATYDGYVDFITSHPGLVVTKAHDVTIDGLNGTVMDLGMVEGGDECPDGAWVDVLIGVEPAHGVWGIVTEPDWVAARMYVLDVDSKPVVLQADDVPGGSDYGDGAGWLDVAGTVIESFDFAD